MKKRLDILTSERLNISRAKAQALIMAGAIFVDDKIMTKSGTEVEEGVQIRAKEIFPYVSRGALKLKEGVEKFGLDFNGKVIADIGASTGGFTDYSLQNGAKKVYAIDTGKGQIAQKLREDRRVILFENTNIKEVAVLPEPIDFFVVDVSFISLKQVLPVLKKIDSKAEIIALIKPQFEVGKEIADKFRGVIREARLQKEAVDDISRFAESLGYKIKGLAQSPIEGAKGNKEFLIYLSCEHSAAI